MVQANISNKISYGIGSHVLLDQLAYGENFFILHSKTQAHREFYRQFLRQSSNARGINLFVSRKGNYCMSNLAFTESYFTTLDIEAIKKINKDVDQCIQSAREECAPALIIFDWEGAGISGCQAGSGGGPGAQKMADLRKPLCRLWSIQLGNQRHYAPNHGKENMELLLESLK